MTGSASKELGFYRLWKRGNWKSGCSNSKIKGMIGGVEDQLDEQDPRVVSRIYLTMSTILEIVNNNQSLKDIAMKIVELSPGFQV